MKQQIVGKIISLLSGKVSDKMVEIFFTVVAGGSFVLIISIFLFITREAAPVLFGGVTAEIQQDSVEVGYEIYNLLPEERSIETIQQGTPYAKKIFISDKKKPEIKVSAWRSFFDKTWKPIGDLPIFGMIPLAVGSLKTTLIAMLLAAPLGIFAAIYSAFFAPRRLREVLKPAIELLAGVPTVVVGVFCLTVISTFSHNVFNTDYYLNTFVGGIGLSIAVLPIIFTISEDSLTAVPKELREAALALGASEWQTVFQVMLPSAFPGIFAAILLGIGRAFGETMIVLMATGNSPLLTWDIFAPTRTIAGTIGAETGEVVWGGTHYHILFFMGFLLFVFTFALNAISVAFIRDRIQRRFFGTM